MIYPLLELIEIIHDTEYGSVAAHKFDINQTQSLRSTKRAHDHAEIVFLNDLYNKFKTNYTTYSKNKVLDIGSNFGLYGRHWAANNPDLFVDMYEPCQSLYNISKLNTIHLPNVSVYSYPIGAQNKIVSLPIYDEKIISNYGCTSLHPDEKLARNDSIFSIVDKVSIACHSLDSLYEDDEEYNFVLVKLDTEGTEGIILENSKNFIKNKKPILFIEHFPEDANGPWVTEIERRGSYSTQWFIDFFKQIDYKILGSMGINIIAIPNHL